MFNEKERQQIQRLEKRSQSCDRILLFAIAGILGVIFIPSLLPAAPIVGITSSIVALTSAISIVVAPIVKFITVETHKNLISNSSRL